MVKVYGVWTGHYSDITLIGLFSTKELAEDLVKSIEDMEKKKTEEYNKEYGSEYTYSSDPRVCEHEVDTLIDYMKNGYKLYWINMILSTGDIQSIDIQDIENSYGDGNYWFWGSTADPVLVGFRIKAKDEQTAIKIASDRRRQLYAEHPNAEKGTGGTF